jgi:hypothetical protein
MSERATRPQADGQLRRAAIVIYATLAIGALCIPTSVSDWVEQLEWEQARAVLLPVASCIVRISKLSGADKPYSVARELFLSMTGKKDPDDAMVH